MSVKSTIKSFLSDSFIYTLLNLLNKAVPFILLPILIRMVSTTDFGDYSLFITIESILVPVVGLNMYAALSSHYYVENVPLKTYFSTIIFAQVIFLLFFSIVAFFLQENFIAKIGLSRNLLITVIVTSSIMSIINLISTFFRLERKPWYYGIYSIGQSILLLTIIIVFCLWKPEFKAIVAGRATFAILFLAGSLLLLKYLKLLGLVFDKEWFKRILTFSLPTVLYSISAFLFLSSDRFLIKYFIGAEAVGYYAAIFQIASVISILGMSLNAAWMPWLFENLKKKETETDIFIVKVSYMLMFSFLIIGLVFCLLFPFIAKIILPEQYHAHIHIAYPLILGYVFEAVYLLVSPYLFFKEKTSYNGLIGFVVAVVNIVMNIVLIPKVGIQGAAYSTLFTWFFLSILFFIFSNKVYPMPWFYFLNQPAIK